MPANCSVAKGENHIPPKMGIFKDSILTLTCFLFVFAAFEFRAFPNYTLTTSRNIAKEVIFTIS